MLRRSLGSRLFIPCCGIGLLALFSALYVADTALYTAILRWMMRQPFPHPFIDWEWIPSAVDCWQRHVDVYVNNTCYAPVALGRHSYSPLWLHMTFLPYGPGWVAPFGLGLAVLFFVSLAALPPQPRIAAACVTFLATFSSLTAFAVERGNVDLIMFLLVIAGTGCWLGTLQWRLVAYGIFILAGLLKFYPFALLVLALREQPVVFAGIGAATIVILTAFGLAFHDELSHIGGSIPAGLYFSGTFAAVNLPYGGTLGAGIETGPAARIIPPVLLVALTLTVMLRAGSLSRRFRLAAALAAMPKPEAGLLCSGAVLICACFFGGQNNGYRAIMLLLTLPGLLWLGRSLPDRAGRVAFMTTGWAIVFVMSTLVIQETILRFTSGHAVLFNYWLWNEIAWWWVISVLLGVLFGFIRGSSMAVHWLPLRTP